MMGIWMSISCILAEIFISNTTFFFIYLLNTNSMNLSTFIFIAFFYFTNSCFFSSLNFKSFLSLVFRNLTFFKKLIFSNLKKKFKKNQKKPIKQRVLCYTSHGKPLDENTPFSVRELFILFLYTMIEKKRRNCYLKIAV
jgi:hypothetical protein